MPLNMFGYLGMKRYFLFPLLLSSPAFAQLSVNTSNNAANLVETLLGPRVNTFGTPVLVAAESAGTFSGGNSAFTAGTGFDQGIIISSGLVTDAIGPNDNTGISGTLNLAGDPRLDAIFQDDGLTDTSNDVTSLTFQFRTESVANLNFNYIFASEEYNEFVNSFNDIFAFLLTPDTNAANDQHDAGNTYNIATIPNTTAGSTTGAVSGFISNGSVVSIDNVNIGDSNDGAAATPVNPSLFVNNDVNAIDPNFVPTDPENHQFDGRTVSLTAEFENLPAGIHEITLIVADANDSLLDSAVFLEQDTFFIIPNSPIPFAIEPILEAGMHASFRDLNSRLLRARSAFEQAGREIYKEGDGSSLIQSSTYNSRFQVFGSGHFYNTDVPGFNGLTSLNQYICILTSFMEKLMVKLAVLVILKSSVIRMDQETLKATISKQI